MLTCGASSFAKRAAPQEVKPVVYNGVKYTAVHWGLSRGLDQNGGYVEASDIKTGKQLWLLRVYRIDYDSREKDVQDVFITKLAIERGRLIVTNEKGEKFIVDLKTRSVSRAD